ncbi:MAG: type 4a pilus biogenesis protein PilO [Candidatus Shapirobacteria bacterium]
MKKENKLTKGSKSLLIQVSRTYEKYRYQEEIWRSLEALLTLSTVILLSIFAIRPTVQAISGLVSEIRNKEELSLKMKKKIDQMIEAQTTYAQVQQEVFLIDQYYPYLPQLTEGLVQLTGLAQQEGLKINNLRLSQADFKNLPEGFEFSFSLQGNYSQSRNFLSSLFQIRRGTTIDNYQMEQDEEAQGELINTKINGSLLFFNSSPKNEK